MEAGCGRHADLQNKGWDWLILANTRTMAQLPLWYYLALKGERAFALMRERSRTQRNRCHDAAHCGHLQPELLDGQRMDSGHRMPDDRCRRWPSCPGSRRRTSTRPSSKCFRSSIRHYMQRYVLEALFLMGNRRWPEPYAEAVSDDYETDAAPCRALFHRNQQSPDGRCHHRDGQLYCGYHADGSWFRTFRVQPRMGGLKTSKHP